MDLWKGKAAGNYVTASWANEKYFPNHFNLDLDLSCTSQLTFVPLALDAMIAKSRQSLSQLEDVSNNLRRVVDADRASLLEICRICELSTVVTMTIILYTIILYTIYYQLVIINCVNCIIKIYLSAYFARECGLLGGNPNLDNTLIQFSDQVDELG